MSWLQIPLVFTFYIFLQVAQVAYAQPTNFTVEDDDPSIRYSPLAAWGWSWDELPTVPSSFDGGGNKVAGIMKRDPQYPSVEYDRIGGGTVPRTKRRRTLSSQARLRTGGEGGQSRSQPPKEMHSATLHFGFTGSAIYLFAYSRPPPFSILIDGQPQILPALSFTPPPDHPPRPSPGDAGPSYSSRIFYSNRTLNEGRHSVTLTFPLFPGSGIAFALDRIVYTQRRNSGFKSKRTLPHLQISAATSAVLHIIIRNCNGGRASSLYIPVSLHYIAFAFIAIPSGSRMSSHFDWLSPSIQFNC
ncbi:hypothetical protein FA13DRAFT_1460074 [Coprinellus micaceus]|uniref:Uncharacterized protein n=1 Tax=Coprinellus micaceus TaxID=71717 RepID=A0A4Y7SMJ2_COPMI|nr:hypothetical protein FA13DRAFT_1460074 [Coprinellus micaceus]